MRYCVTPSLADSSRFKNPLEFFLIVANCRFALSIATPKIILVCDSRGCFQFTENKIRQNRPDGYSRFLRVKKNPFAVEPVRGKRNRVTDSQARVAHQENETL